MTFQRKKIGDILKASGLVSKEQLAEALKRQSETKGRLGKILVQLGILTEEQLAKALSEQLQVPRVDLETAVIAQELVDLLPRKFIKERQVLPVGEEKNRLLLAMVDPLDYMTINDVQFLTGKSIQPMVTTAANLDLFLKGKFRHTSDVKEALRRIQPSDQIEVLEGSDEGEEDILRLKKAGEAAPIISMVNMILSEAVKADASDIHIEPRPRDLLVRYRIDGLLRDMTTLPAYVHQSVVSRVKIMAKMDIAVRRRPQDGSTKIKMGDREIDLRISTLPTLYGEKMVIRILEKSRQIMALEDLGMQARDLTLFRTFLSRPQGMILATGPTGSGKTTTLYAALLHVRSEDVNIITVEDPVEYQIPGINQVHVNEKAGITFATGLRSLLRQDPNIIMVGEIRDYPTAEIAFQAALTGHLVLSSLHTNNAVAAVTRLVDIGIEPYLVASSVVGVVAQRLVRRNCPFCLTEYRPESKVLADLRLEPDQSDRRFFRGAACERCHNTGYQGRTGIYEILKVDDTIRELIINRASEKKILSAARAVGMTTMEEDGFAKVLNRITTPEEILRVIPPEEITVKEAATDDPAPGMPPTATAQETVVDTAPAPEGIFIILVEREEDNLKDLEELLRGEGYTCGVAKKGMEVLAFLRAHPSAPVISDILLEDVDIGELDKFLKGSEVSAKTKLLAVSDGRKSIKYIKPLGFSRDRIINRPFKIKDIREKISKIISGFSK